VTLIRAIDIETVGFEPPKGDASGIVEIGWCDLAPSEAGWRVAGGGSALINPGCPIPPEASAVHHLVDEDVAHAPPWHAVAPLVFTGEPVAYAAHNAKFERLWCTPAVAGDRSWICTHKGALRLWREAPLHSNQGLRYWRRPDGLDRALADMAHRAFPDAYVTAHHLRDLLQLASLDELIRWSSEPALQVRCQFGKHRGTSWSEVDTGFLRWVSERDFDEDVLFTVKHEIERRERAARAGSEAA